MDFSNIKSFKKIKGLTASRISKLDPEMEIEFIMNVLLDDYVPNEVTLRNRISSTLFTGVTKLKMLDKLDNNNLVKSMTLNQTLRTIW
ncbi:MAG: hypothetical protein R3321_02490 [Nitrososphaeraceae archaeon]|nr:hypothetical protein [Nitrososphaeraceae archaeon]